MTTSSENCLIIAGEKSGEDHAMTFLPELMKLCPNVNFFGVGGDQLQSLNVELLYHLKDFSSFGFTDVVGKIPFYFRALNNLFDEAKKRKIKTAILIDFQDFNLRLAKKLKKIGVNVLYYVAPQAWVWKPKRAKVLEETVHTLFTIIPFEKDWFKERGVTRVQSVPHPVYSKRSIEIKNIKTKKFSNYWQTGESEINICLLPGSRNSEVSLMLSKFIKTIGELKKLGFKFKVSLVKTTSVKKIHYEKYENYVDYIAEASELGNVLKTSDFCIASSGTVTLECALFQVPTVVCYGFSLFEYWLGSILVPYTGPCSLANIIFEKRVFPELVHEELSVFNIKRELMKLLTDQQVYEKMVTELNHIESLLCNENLDVPQYMSQVLLEQE